MSEPASIISPEYVAVLDSRDEWADAQDKAEKLVIAFESKYMPAIANTEKLLDVLLIVGLRALSQQQLSFLIDQVLFIVIKNLLEHREYQSEENYMIVEQIVYKTIQLAAATLKDDFDHPKIIEILAFIFNPARNFYSNMIVLNPNITAPTISTDYPVNKKQQRTFEQPFHLARSRIPSR